MRVESDEADEADEADGDQQPGDSSNQLGRPRCSSSPFPRSSHALLVTDVPISSTRFHDGATPKGRNPCEAAWHLHMSC